MKNWKKPLQSALSPQLWSAWRHAAAQMPDRNPMYGGKKTIGFVAVGPEGGFRIR